MGRFYDVEFGAVQFDNIDLKNLPLKRIRANFGLVSQELTLYTMTAMDNLKLGCPDVTDEEVKAAAQTADAHDFTEKLPDGYNTLIGQKGVQLSGGQDQRVATAKAVLETPVVLLLDEATSALDAESESQVQDALERLMKGRTTLVVAYRLSAIRKASKMAVMKKGRVVEQGTRGELLQDPGGLTHY